jgi:hypothetical protein
MHLHVVLKQVSHSKPGNGRIDRQGRDVEPEYPSTRTFNPHPLFSNSHA